MIEIVARVLFGWMHGHDRWDEAEPEEREDAIEAARDVISAMREPTEAMRAAVENDARIQGGLDDCNQHDIPDNVWSLMIEAARK